MNDTRLAYPIGTTYRPAGKHAKTCTVVDAWITANLAGEVVKIRYVSTHEFCGQTVRNLDVLPTTIARGLLAKEAK